ncbi:hypothetical protein Tsubulata_030420 [Turnera subulata]|uniref:Pseudouridine synthase RsuA/RluA-like domain-containing protein n=1 Tax=Turnera subulata TaxID=218843 RepID=A0A9Q0J3C0_9ROSI|nr:hypothetical protein Tsubulata_030420 [Turnera subulata]
MPNLVRFSLTIHGTLLNQIRAHAKYIGIPLLGDEVYGGTRSMALSLLRSRTPASYHSQASHLLSKLERPCLHAVALGFTHPWTGNKVHFSSLPPPDFTEILRQLREMGTEKLLSQSLPWFLWV